MMIGKFGLRLDSKSKFVNVFGIENLYAFLVDKMTTDYFELVRIRECIRNVISDKTEYCDIVTDDYGCFRIGAINTVLIWENHYEEDLPDVLVRGYVSTSDVLQIVNAVIKHIENENWNPYLEDLNKLYSSISNFYFDKYEFVFFGLEKSFSLNFRRKEEEFYLTNFVQNSIEVKNRRIIINSNFSKSKEDKLFWNINEVDSFHDFLKTGIDKLESK